MVKPTDFAYLDQYQDIWLMEPQAFNLLKMKAEGLDLAAHMETVQRIRSEIDMDAYNTELLGNGVAVLHINGVMMKQVSSLSSGTSTVLARRSLRNLVQNDQVQTIVLKYESPGGTSSGTQEFFDDIQKAAQQKTVVSYIEDLGASAAYYAASGASKIYANAPARVGSIGTYMVVADYSAAAEKEGIKVHVVKAGAHKGVGVPGTEITEEQLADIQRLVDSANEFFLQSVATGRSMNIDAVRALADGRVHSAAEALEMKLIDGIMTWDALLDSLSNPSQANLSPTASRGTTGNNSRRTKQMADQVTQAAAITEIKSACPGITSDQILAFAEAGKTLQQCQGDYMTYLAEQVQSLSVKNAELQAKLDEVEASAKAAEAAQAATKAKLENLGVDPVTETKSKGIVAGSATDQFWAEVAEFEAQGMKRQDAVKAVNKANPGLRQAMIAEANQK